MEEKSTRELLSNLKESVLALPDSMFTFENKEISKEIDELKSISKILGIAARTHQSIVDKLQKEFSKRWHTTFYVQPNTPKNWVGDERFICGLNLFIGLESYNFLKIGVNITFLVKNEEKKIYIESPANFKATRVQISLTNFETMVYDEEFIQKSNTENRKTLSFKNSYIHRQEHDFTQYAKDCANKYTNCLNKFLLVKFGFSLDELTRNIITESFKERILSVKNNKLEPHNSNKYMHIIKSAENALKEQEKEHLIYTLQHNLSIKDEPRKKSKI